MHHVHLKPRVGVCRCWFGVEVGSHHCVSHITCLVWLELDTWLSRKKTLLSFKEKYTCKLLPCYFLSHSFKFQLIIFQNTWHIIRGKQVLIRFRLFCCFKEKRLKIHLSGVGPVAARLLREKVFLWCVVKEMGRNCVVGRIYLMALWVPFTVTLRLCRPSIWFFLWDTQFVFTEEVTLGITSDLISLSFLRLFPLLVWLGFFLFSFFLWLLLLWGCETVYWAPWDSGKAYSPENANRKPHDFYLGFMNWIRMDLVIIPIFKWMKYFLWYSFYFINLLFII